MKAMSGIAVGALTAGVVPGPPALAARPPFLATPGPAPSPHEFKGATMPDIVKYRLDITISSDRTFLLESSEPHHSFPHFVTRELKTLQRQGLLTNGVLTIHSNSRALIKTQSFQATNSPGVAALRHAVAGRLARRWRVPVGEIGYSCVRLEW